MRLKILTYNIHKGFDIFNRRLVLALIKQQIRLLLPDIVCLQEVQGEHLKHRQREGWPIEAQFEYLADTLWPHYAYGKNAIYPQGHHGNALLSKYPIKAWNNLDLSLDKSERRGLLHAEILLPEQNRSFHLLNTHLNLFHRARVKQLDLIVNYVTKNLSQEAPKIFAGDFNDWNKALQPLICQRLAMKEAFTELYREPQKTFPCFYPVLSLDRIYLQHAIPIQGTALRSKPWQEMSDHLPLLLEIEI